jgi:hypothetical protein
MIFVYKILSGDVRRGATEQAASAVCSRQERAKCPN